MSLKTIYDQIKARLTTDQQALFHFGARNLPKTAGPTRIVFIPVQDTFTQRARQGKTAPREIWGAERQVIFEIIAPTVEAIDGPFALLSLLISVCQELYPGSFMPTAGVWEQISDVSVRGERYLLTITFKSSIVETTPQLATVVTTATPDDAPITGEINE